MLESLTGALLKHRSQGSVFNAVLSAKLVSRESLRLVRRRRVLSLKMCAFSVSTRTQPAVVEPLTLQLCPVLYFLARGFSLEAWKEPVDVHAILHWRSVFSFSQAQFCARYLKKGRGQLGSFFEPLNYVCNEEDSFLCAPIPRKLEYQICENFNV